MKRSEATAEVLCGWPKASPCKFGKRVLLLKKNLWKNCTNLLQDMPTIYVNFNIIIMRVSQTKEIGARNFVPQFLDHMPGANAI